MGPGTWRCLWTHADKSRTELTQYPVCQPSSVLPTMTLPVLQIRSYFSHIFQRLILTIFIRPSICKWVCHSLLLPNGALTNWMTVIKRNHSNQGTLLCVCHFSENILEQITCFIATADTKYATARIIRCWTTLRMMQHKNQTSRVAFSDCTSSVFLEVAAGAATVC